MKKFIQPFEIAVIIITLFLVGSTSVFWYERYHKSAEGKRERQIRLKWEQDVTDRVNSINQWRKQVTDIINENIRSGKITGVK